MDAAQVRILAPASPMKNKIMLGLLVTLVVVTSGCVDSKNPDKADSETKVELDTGLQGNEEIRKITLTDDGETINCYVYNQHNGYAGMGGISCIPEAVSNR